MSVIYLEPNQLEMVREILRPYHKRFFVFGSRAKGTHRPLSDLDIVSRAPLSKLEVSEINEKFDESNLPFKVDLILWDEIEETFQKRISPDLTPIFV